jgi:hypothetical protein
MDLLDQQLPALKNWDKFEALTRALFAAVWEIVWPDSFDDTPASGKSSNAARLEA